MTKSHTKFAQLRIVLEEFASQKKLDAKNHRLKEQLDLSERQIRRLLEEVAEEIDAIEVQREGKKNVYQLIDANDLFVTAFKNTQERDIGWIFHMAKEGDPEIFQELEEFTKQEKGLYLFKSTPFEDVSTFEANEIFKHLKNAIKRREYRKIKFKDASDSYDNLRCLRLIFMDNNWYVAYVDGNDMLRLSRLSFIESVEYASNVSNFQPKGVEKHMQFLEELQNSMTLYGVVPQKAIIKAAPNVAKYFDKGMKRFLSAQEFIRKEEDGSVVFSLAYTQPLEILPLIQRWLPDLSIIEPQELKEEFSKKLSQALLNHTS